MTEGTLHGPLNSSPLKNSRGACLCGAVRYEITADPIALFCCHCSECQTTSGSSFVLALRIPYGGVNVITGEVKLYERPEANGQTRNVARCPRCLTALWSERVDAKEYQTVYAGTLDASPALRPVAHIWTQDAQPWITLSKETVQYTGNPPNMEAIIQAWLPVNENTG
jgi:hypothetical protein